MEQWQDMTMKNLFRVLKISPSWISANASLYGKMCQKLSGRFQAKKLPF